MGGRDGERDGGGHWRQKSQLPACAVIVYRGILAREITYKRESLFCKENEGWHWISRGPNWLTDLETIQLTSIRALLLMGIVGLRCKR